VAQTTCSADGCGTATVSKGMCRKHYHALWKAQNPEKVVAYRRKNAERYNARRRSDQRPLAGRSCAECGGSFDAEHRNENYCGLPCRRKAERLRAKENNYGAEAFTCYHCGNETLGRIPKKDQHHKRRYCTPECQAKAKSWLYRTIFSMPVPWSNCERCEARFIQRGKKARCRDCQVDLVSLLRVRYSKVCQSCGERYETSQPHQLTCTKKCASRRTRQTQRQRHGRQDTHRKRARRYGCEYEPVSRTKVFERDGYVCQICGEATSSKYSFDDPWSPTVDHIVPMSKQGAHSYENIQCAHAFCNSVKNDKSDADVWELAQT